MEGFSYNNIFETKGIEYLIIIAFLFLIIPFWLLINRKAGIKGKARNVIGVLSSGMLRIPQGVFYSRFHTWAHLEISGIAKVGIDDFLQHITGEVKFCNLKPPGSFISKGELLADIDQNGKFLQIYSPISGEVMNTNPMLFEEPGILNEDPFGKGWIYRIKPTKWIAETSSCFMAEEAVSWSKKELERFKDFILQSAMKYSPETSMVMLQDGGELYDKPLNDLPNEVWQDFQKTFLNSDI
jgi:glycine cleavage system H protein